MYSNALLLPLSLSSIVFLFIFLLAIPKVLFWKILWQLSCFKGNRAGSKVLKKAGTAKFRDELRMNQDYRIHQNVWSQTDFYIQNHFDPVFIRILPNVLYKYTNFNPNSGLGLEFTSYNFSFRVFLTVPVGPILYTNNASDIFIGHG